MSASQPPENVVLYELSDELSGKLGLDPLPFPIRRSKAKTIFGKREVRFDSVLDELDIFLSSHQEHIPDYRFNVATLAMICATQQMHNEDADAAIASLEIGLRADPLNRSLRLHHALALQAVGRSLEAGSIYEEVLNEEPAAEDPLVRVLAAKAFAAAGHKKRGLKILDVLTEAAFEDEGLSSLYKSLSAPGNSRNKKFCTSCGKERSGSANFCSSCGAPSA